MQCALCQETSKSFLLKNYKVCLVTSLQKETDNHAPRPEIVSVIEEWAVPSNPPPPGAVAMQNHMSEML
jgi:hypothetical protein